MYKRHLSKRRRHRRILITWIQWQSERMQSTPVFCELIVRCTKARVLRKTLDLKINEIVKFVFSIVQWTINTKRSKYNVIFQTKYKFLNHFIKAMKLYKQTSKSLDKYSHSIEALRFCILIPSCCCCTCTASMKENIP